MFKLKILLLNILLSISSTGGVAYPTPVPHSKLKINFSDLDAIVLSPGLYIIGSDFKAKYTLFRTHSPKTATNSK